MGAARSVNGGIGGRENIEIVSDLPCTGVMDIQIRDEFSAPSVLANVRNRYRDNPLAGKQGEICGDSSPLTR